MELEGVRRGTVRGPGGQGGRWRREEEGRWRREGGGRWKVGVGRRGMVGTKDRRPGKGILVPELNQILVLHRERQKRREK